MEGTAHSEDSGDTDTGQATQSPPDNDEGLATRRSSHCV